MREIKLFINNEFVTSSDGRHQLIHNPANNEVLAKAYLPSFKDLDSAVEAAEAAFYSAEWRAFDQNKRADYLAAFWNVVNWDKVAERFAGK